MALIDKIPGLRHFTTQGKIKRLRQGQFPPQKIVKFALSLKKNEPLARAAQQFILDAMEKKPKLWVECIQELLKRALAGSWQAEKILFYREESKAFRAKAFKLIETHHLNSSSPEIKQAAIAFLQALAYTTLSEADAETRARAKMMLAPHLPPPSHRWILK